MCTSPDPVRTESNGPPPRTLPRIDFRSCCTRPCTVISTGESTSIVPELVEMSASKAAFEGRRTFTLPEPELNLPRAALSSFGGNVAASGFAVECAVNAARSDIPGASVHVDVTRSGFFNFNVAASGAALHRTGNLASPHIARSGLQMNFAGQPGQVSHRPTRFARRRCRACLR